MARDGIEPVSYTHLDVYKRQGRGVELAAVLALGAGEAGEEILIHAAEQIDGAMCLLPLAGGGEADGCLLYTSRCV